MAEKLVELSGLINDMPKQNETFSAELYIDHCGRTVKFDFQKIHNRRKVYEDPRVQK